MSKGTVKDPEGHQSRPYDFGFIQRTGPDAPEWLENGKAVPKVIPFLSEYKENGTPGERTHKVNDKVIFNVKRAFVVLNGEILGSIGIATSVDHDPDA